MFAPHRAAGPVRGSAARAWTRTVLQPIARCPTFALRPRKSFAIVHRDRSLRSLRIGAIAGFDAAAPLRVLRWASRRDWARIGESRAEVSGECSQDFQELRSSAGPGARRSGRPGPRSGSGRRAARCYTRAPVHGHSDMHVNSDQWIEPHNWNFGTYIQLYRAQERSATD